MYEVHFDFTAMRSQLATIEQGGPLRMLKTTSLMNAIGMANIVLMAAGYSMRSGQRRVERHSTLDMSTGNIVIKIVRR